jgi:hypothetical protein
MEEVFHGEVEIVDGKVDSINIHEKTIEIKILAGYVQLKTMDRLAEDVHCEINAMHRRCCCENGGCLWPEGGFERPS